MMTVHQLKDAKGREATTKCGLTVKPKGGEPMMTVASVWGSDVTCEACRAR